jgi:hypothetical protein
LARAGEEYLVRDSKANGGPILSFGRAAWDEFVAAVTAGDFSAE